MNNLENYKSIVENEFGDSVCSFDTSTEVTNPIMGALNNSNYTIFANNFINRLKRLNKIYTAPDDNRSHLINTINQIAKSNNWRGAFAELTAYDFFNNQFLENRTCLSKPIMLNRYVSNNRTFSEELGLKGDANLDGYFQNFDVYFEVKSLKDNVTEILEGIFEELYCKFNTLNFLITAEYSFDMHYGEIQKNRNEIRAEIIQAIKAENKRPNYIKSNVIDNLRFKILWERGIVTRELSYNSYQHAKEYSDIIFKHVNKFARDRPFILVFVIFPWFNNAISSFNDKNRIFYRAFSRRVFCQYLHDGTPYKQKCSDFTGDQTLFQITQKISGIVFLEDMTITAKEPNELNVESYFYFNPNADNKLSKSLFWDYSMSLQPRELDDFRYDNY